MKSYHFSLGNSSQGPIGYCARVNAESPEAAVEKLKAAVGENVEIESMSDDPDVQYIFAYLNPDFISTKDIDEVNEVKAEKP